MPAVNSIGPREELSLPSGEELFETYSQDIYYYLLRCVRSHEMAEDLLQDTFYRACKFLPRLQGASNVQAWLYRIAKNIVIDHIRHQRRITWQSIDECQQYEREIDYPDLQAQDPAEYVNIAIIEAALLQIPEHYRKTLLLSIKKEHTIEEIARELGFAPSYGKMLLSRARQHFRKRYYELWNL